MIHLHDRPNSGEVVPILAPGKAPISPGSTLTRPLG
jgi:hypothetical protein